MKRLLLAAIAAMITLPATAQIGVAVRAGTLGPGVEVAYKLSPKLALRATGSTYTYTTTEELDEEVTVSFDAEATVGAIGAIVDFHPFNNLIRLSGGITVNLFEVSGQGTPTESYCFGDEDAGGVCDGKVFTPQRMGSMGMTVSHPSSVAPYVGLGFGRVAGTKRVGFLFDVGTLYTGSPEIDLVADGLLAPTASTDQEATLNEGIESFQWYPVVSLGLAIRL
ncbi:MAG: hypothetical protein JJ896_03985 [Rhodothermales bacterium]|nr:hypothetical protein [Rhodothermales bacterium]MBO6778796.1 hypothetical protein [Rhodothermales bacterium]